MTSAQVGADSAGRTFEEPATAREPGEVRVFAQYRSSRNGPCAAHRPAWRARFSQLERISGVELLTGERVMDRTGEKPQKPNVARFMASSPGRP